MTLRSRWRFFILGVLLLAAAAGADSAAATTGAYPSPLYLSGSISTLLGTSYALVPNAGPGQPTTAPTVLAGATASPGLSGTYSYAYTLVDPTGGETAVSPTSTTVTVAGNDVTVGGLPTGVTVRLYRAKTGFLTRVAELPANSSATYTDAMPDTTANASTVLPQSQNRTTTSGTGYQDFAPGGYAPLTNPTMPSTVSTTPNGKGWIVDDSGSVSFAAGTWTFQAKLKQNANSGTSHLVVGMWKVTIAGGVITNQTLLVDPTCATAPCGENMTNVITTSGSKTITHAVMVNAFTLASGEHLYVQLWRRQTAGSIGGAANQLSTLYNYDGTTTQVMHPAANALPSTPTVNSAAPRVKTPPTLSATFSDPDAGDTGTLSFELCADNTCSAGSVPANTGTVSGIANGASGTWTPTGPLADGTYYWHARAQDSAGGWSENWSTPASFTIDNTPPGVPTLTAPGAAARIATAQLAATFNDSDPADSGTLSFQLCANADTTCAHPAATTTSASLANGTSSTWTLDVLGDGTYYWRARAKDNAGNESAWSPLRSFTIDTTPPSAPAVPTVRTRLRSAPVLAADVTDDTVRGLIQLCADSTCADVRTIGVAARAGAGIAWQAPNLPDGTYYWRALAEDGVGNDSGWSTTASFVIDTVAPAVPVVDRPVADATVSRIDLSGAFVSLDAGETGKITFQLCADPECGSVLISWWSSDAATGTLAHWTAVGVGDGTYFWRVAARDAAGNSSAWSDTRRLTLDTTPPAKPQALQATRSKQTLALHWKTPTGADAITGYALFVNGKRTRTIGVDKLGVDIHLAANDRRTFAIAAIDAAGNVGPRTQLVTGKPAVKQAKAKTKTPPHAKH